LAVSVWDGQSGVRSNPDILSRGVRGTNSRSGRIGVAGRPYKRPLLFVVPVPVGCLESQALVLERFDTALHSGGQGRWATRYST
jgi:hypothetical protein